VLDRDIEDSDAADALDCADDSDEAEALDCADDSDAADELDCPVEDDPWPPAQPARANAKASATRIVANAFLPKPSDSFNFIDASVSCRNA
jgi:hypothetical protein